MVCVGLYLFYGLWYTKHQQKKEEKNPRDKSWPINAHLKFFYLFSDRDASEMTRRQSRRVISKERRRWNRKVFLRPEGFRFMTISFNTI